MEEKPEKAFIIMNRFCFSLLLLLFTILSGCSDDSQDSEIPFVNVDITVNLTNQQFLSLQNVNGHATISGGVRGIILYRESADTYLAFERNCSYQPLEACSIVEVDASNLFMVDQNCCGSIFDWFGIPTSGPASVPLRKYTTTLDGIFLRITNGPI